MHRRAEVGGEWDGDQEVDSDLDDDGGHESDAAGPDADADGDADANADAEGGVGGTWVTIAPGTFQMGSPASEPGRGPDETQHLVTLTHRFEIPSTEVTQAQFEDRMRYDPSHLRFCGGDCPVETVNWHEAAAYCNALSAAAGLGLCYTCSGRGAGVTCDDSASYPNPYACPGHRLPTEAEWEFAARAGTTGGTYNGTCDDAHLACEQPNPVLDSIAWFCGNTGFGTHAGGTLAANPWGLYDMLGNVLEWCADWWDGADYPAGSATDPWGLTAGSYRVVRGGAWYRNASHGRAADRGGHYPAIDVNYLGFRPARSLP